MAMKMVGEYVLRAGREIVWAALNDADVLQACIPGCEEFEKVSETDFRAAARVKIGPVGAVFRGKVALFDIDPPKGYRIEGQGQGGVAGFAKGVAVVRLADAEANAGGVGTALTYEVEAQVGGKLAQVGQRLINGAAKKMADQFFDNFRREVEQADAARPPHGSRLDAATAGD